MLPYTPLHHLLLRDVGRPLVMTSGNLSDEPIAYRQRRRARAAGGDRRLLPAPRPRDRDALRRLGRARHRRRAGGAAPLARLRAAAHPRVAARSSAPVLACGALLKNTFCIGAGDTARTSGRTSATSRTSRPIDRLRGSRSSGWSGSSASRPRSSRTTCIPTTCRRATRWRGPSRCKIGVQHHHAHVVSAMAEHGLTAR